MELRKIHCHQCGVEFCLCRRCDRGQRYCSKKCRELARRAVLNRARIKYASSSRGRIQNRLRQQRYRQRKRGIFHVISKTVTDHSSHKIVIGLESLHEDTATVSGKGPPRPGRSGAEGVCFICGCRGVIVEQVSLRGRFRARTGDDHARAQTVAK